MSTVYVYGYDTDQFKDDLQFLIFPTISSQNSTQFSFKNVGFLDDTLTFVGNFTTSSGVITGGTITEVKLSGSYGQGIGGLEVDIPNLNIPITSDGYNLSFSLGSILTTGSTYHEEAHNSYIVGYGNDIFYGGFGTTITPGGGINTIYASGASEQINLKGSSTSDSFIFSSSGTLTIIDYSSPTSAAADAITGSAKLLFEGDDVFVNDNNGVLTLTKTAAAAVSSGQVSASELIAVSDSAANVVANLDGLQALYVAGRLAGISLTDSGIPALSLSPTQLSADAGVLGSFGGYVIDVSGLTVDAAVQLAASHQYTVDKLGISDSAANVLASLDKLESLADAGQLGRVSLTGGSPVLALTPAQTVADGQALAAITGGTAFTVDAGTASQTIDGVSGHATTVIFGGASSQYTIVSSGGGITVTQGGVVDHLTNVTALQFSDVTDIVASQTSGTANGVSSFQVATLYSAVLARAPDPAGLAFYETYAASNATVPVTTYAEWFLQSPEYTAKHSYAQTSAGDSQFIADTYQNLLHRAPEAGAVSFYLTNVVQPMLANLTAGSSAYGAAELAAHAQVLAYFSQSPEFQGDVQVTAQTPSSAQHWLVLV